MPYVGDLQRADIFLLQLNPGFRFADYYGEGVMLSPSSNSSQAPRLFCRRDRPAGPL